MAKRKPSAPHAPVPHKDSRPEKHVADRTAAILAGVGLLITAYLTYVAASSSALPFCAEGSGCDLVQQSRWSRFLGMPIALWGFATYALLLLLALMPATRLRRWRRLWTLSLVGLGISLYLTAVGYLELDTFCLWCLASLATLAALFGYLNLTRPASAPGTPWLTWSLGHGAVLLVVVGVMHLYYSGLFSPRPEPRLQALALHLKQTGAEFYGASWCPACQEQKALFGGAADDLPYIECSPQGRSGAFAFACISADIQGFPTWIIRGQRYQNVLPPEELAQRSGFDWRGFGKTP